MILLKIVSLGFLAVASAVCILLLQQINAELKNEGLVYKAFRAAIIIVWIATFLLVIGVILT